jgi:hypothetical protein
MIWKGEAGRKGQSDGLQIVAPQTTQRADDLLLLSDLHDEERRPIVMIDADMRQAARQP